MKKVVFIMLMLLCTITMSARTVYTATSVSCSIGDAPWSDWCKMNCSLVLNQENKQVIIYSDIDYSTSSNTFSVNYYKNQVIDYGSVYTSYGTNNQGCHYRSEYIKGNDQDGRNCSMNFLIFDDGDLMFYIEYNNIKYKYMLQRTE